MVAAMKECQPGNLKAIGEGGRTPELLSTISVHVPLRHAASDMTH